MNKIRNLVLIVLFMLLCSLTANAATGIDCKITVAGSGFVVGDTADVSIALSNNTSQTISVDAYILRASPNGKLAFFSISGSFIETADLLDITTWTPLVSNFAIPAGVNLLEVALLNETFSSSSPLGTYNYYFLLSQGNSIDPLNDILGFDFSSFVLFTSSGQGTRHTGIINADETWDPSGNPHIVTGNVTVAGPDPKGVTLTILPGVIVRVEEGVSIDIGSSNEPGTLIAQGDKGAEIVFTSNQTFNAKGLWRHIAFNAQAVGSKMSHCVVEYGGVYGSCSSQDNIVIYGSGNVELDNCTIINGVSSEVAFSGGDSFYRVPDLCNYNQMSWIDAYDGLFKQMSDQYPFTEWKGIDWVALNYEIRPKIVQAVENDDEAAYATAILEYTKSIPDGHILPMGGMLFDLCEEQVAGSYGLGIMGLSDGRVIAHIVTEGGQAAKAGMEAGDEIIEWNGLPIADAIEQTSTMWRLEPKSLSTGKHSMLDIKSIATDAHLLLEKYRMLVLDPVNTQINVVFSKSEGTELTATLTALGDNDVVLNKTALWDKVDDTDPIKCEILSSGYGYLLLGSLENDDADEKLQKAMVFFADENVPGIIIDLRGSRGGDDESAATFLGYFYSETTIYEYLSSYNTLTGKFEFVLPVNDDFVRDKSLNIEHKTPFYSKPIVVIVNPLCISSSEGVAMGLKNLPNCHVVGFQGSNGSFGIMSGTRAILPGMYGIMFPIGRSLDKNKIIQVDSQNGIGGITPDIRIPMTREIAIRVGTGEDVELQYAIDNLKNR